MDVEPTLLAEPDEENADSLVAENEPDDMANEQTWPTEEEMNGGHPRDGDEIPDATNGTIPKAVKRRPKGMSEYQAAWIVEDDDEAAEDGDQAGEDDDMDKDQEETEEVEDEDTEMEVESRRSVAFEDLDVEEEAKQ